MYDPGADAAARYPDVRIKRVRLEVARAAFIPARQLILIDRRLGRAGWEACVAHELVHLDRGDQCSHDDDVLHLKQEREVEVEAARRLIPFDRLLAALTFGRDEQQLAQELDVDLELLRVRCDWNNLTETERRQLDDHRAEHAEWGAA